MTHWKSAATTKQSNITRPKTAPGIKRRLKPLEDDPSDQVEMLLIRKLPPISRKTKSMLDIDKHSERGGSGFITRQNTWQHPIAASSTGFDDSNSIPTEDLDNPILNVSLVEGKLPEGDGVTKPKRTPKTYKSRDAQIKRPPWGSRPMLKLVSDVVKSIEIKDQLMFDEQDDMPIEKVEFNSTYTSGMDAFPTDFIDIAPTDTMISAMEFGNDRTIDLDDENGMGILERLMIPYNDEYAPDIKSQEVVVIALETSIPPAKLKKSVYGSQISSISRSKPYRKPSVMLKAVSAVRKKKSSDSSSDSDSEYSSVSESDEEIEIDEKPTPKLVGRGGLTSTLQGRTDQSKSSTSPKMKESIDPLLPAKINPLTKLNISQYDLFSSTAGGFRGPGDVYYKFVLGGKSVRAGAKRLKNHQIREVEMGRLDELLVEKSKIHTTLWNHKSVARLREKHKDVVSNQISDKVTELEQIRAYIITSIYSLNTFKILLVELMEQNEQLKEEHKFVMANSNKKVSSTLSVNEQSVERIVKLEREKIHERKRVLKEFGWYLRKCEDERSGNEMINLALEKVMEGKRNALHAKSKDMEDLIEFEKKSFEDPSSSAKRLVIEYELRDIHLKDLSIQIAAYDGQFKALDEEFAQKVIDKGLAIFEASVSKFNDYFESVTKKASNRNHNLKYELSKHYELVKQLEKQIQVERKEQQRHFADAKREEDPRRRVLRLKEFMNCTPSMDIPIE